ncbi:hypothetical protein V6N11_071987 [Hibiscus sabdariffa]|uniref:Uncharacterized protein n=1 Tax=Hibiscus sabdariffa TaxID=183260 RepID=A0ABR2U1Y7_9ROSI
MAEATCPNSNLASRDDSGDDSHSTDSSACSTDIPDLEIVGDEDNHSEASVPSNGLMLPAWTLAGQNLHTEASTSAIDSVSNQQSRSLRLSDNSVAKSATKFLDDNVPFRKKIKRLSRLANVKHDGTVQCDIPTDIEPHTFDSGFYSEAPEKENTDTTDIPNIPPLQIVMLIVGTRGDVQPFVAIGKRLQADGHRVRLATHSNFKDFVLNAGLEFFPLGGDPKVLAGYISIRLSPLRSEIIVLITEFFADMVKNKGFLPSAPSEIPVQRQQMKEIIFSLLDACRANDPDSDVKFDVDAIIANPPAYGHTHVAEALKVPLHIFFTMPWTPTSEFPHPLSRVKQHGYRLSYHIVDSLIWLGIRDMIKELRRKKLKLRRAAYLSGSHSSLTDVPYGYIWSPHLVPKPKDWGPKIDVVGFCFLDLASSYEPPESLVKWLKDGDKPIYIGFGSLPVQEPERMTQIIVQALEKTRQRGIINKGWGGLGNLAEPPDFVYLLDNCPHDWLFLQCSAVVHHGGAGTTAAGLKAACPTTIVPFFGDQPFWGERVHARGVGPAPIPIEEFSLDKLVDAINFMLDPQRRCLKGNGSTLMQVKKRAVDLANAMEGEDGVAGAVNAFYKHFPVKNTKEKPEGESDPNQTHSGFSITSYFGHS